jgi:hypothetical protein
VATARQRDLKAQPADLAERARRWVEESTKAQGLPVKISDPATIRRVAEILREGRKRNRRQT